MLYNFLYANFNKVITLIYTLNNFVIEFNLFMIQDAFNVNYSFDTNQYNIIQCNLIDALMMIFI